MLSHKKRIVILLCCLFMSKAVDVLSISVAQTEDAGHKALSIFFTDGFRGRLQSDTVYLGLNAFETAMRQHQSRLHENNVLTLDLGNSVAPYYLSRMDEGRSMLEAMEEIGYDAMVPGNYEFDYGADFFSAAKNTERRLSIVCANLLRPDGAPFLQPYRIVERGGLKVAILGIMDVEMRKHILDENFVVPSDQTGAELQLVEPSIALKELIPKVQKEADLIVVISNFPYEKNLTLADELSGIDLIISRQGKALRYQHTAVNKPDEASGGRTLVVTAGAYLGQIDISVPTSETSQDDAFDVKFRRIAVDGKSEPSPALMAKVEMLEGRFKTYCQQRFQLPPDATLRQLPPDITEEDFARFVLYAMLFRTHSELGLIHNGHFDFAYWQEVIADGQLTLRECFLLMPENHGLLTTRLGGKVLNQLASQSQAEKNADRDYLHFLSVKPVLDEAMLDPLLFSIEVEFEAGLDDGLIFEDLQSKFAANGVSISMDAPVTGQSPLWLIIDENNMTYTVRKDGNQLNIHRGQWFVHKIPIRDDEIYAACSINYLVNGGSAFSGLTTGSHVKDKFKMTSYLRFAPEGETRIIRDVLIDYLREHPSNQPLPTGAQLAQLPYLRRAFWRLHIQDTSLSFNVNRDRNSEIYDKVTIPELKNEDITSLRLQGQLKVIRETAGLLWENGVETDLGRIKVGDTPASVDQDNISVSTDLVFKSLNIKGLQPFAGLRFDTEFINPPEGNAQRDFHIRAGIALPDVWRFTSSRLNYSRIIDLNRGEDKRQGLNTLNFDTNLAFSAGALGWLNTFEATYFLPGQSEDSERRQFLIDFESSLQIPVVQNFSLAPTFEAIFFKGMDNSEVAQEYLFAVKLSYFKDWKWQYLRYFLGAQKN